MNIIFKILCTSFGLWTITLCAILTAMITPNIMMFEISYEYIKLLVFWLGSIVLGCFSLEQIKKYIIEVWKGDN